MKRGEVKGECGERGREKIGNVGNLLNKKMQQKIRLVDNFVFELAVLRKCKVNKQTKKQKQNSCQLQTSELSF